MASNFPQAFGRRSGIDPRSLDSSMWNDYELQKDGTDGQDVINFKT